MEVFKVLTVVYSVVSLILFRESVKKIRDTTHIRDVHYQWTTHYSEATSHQWKCGIKHSLM